MYIFGDLPVDLCRCVQHIEPHATTAYLKTAAVGALLGSLGVSASGTALAAADGIDPLAFDSTASQLNADGEPLTDDSLVAVWAAETATNVDEDDDDDAVVYPDGVDIPLVTSDGGVVGFGAPIVQNGTNFEYGNEEFVLNVLDAEADGPAVAFDDGHGQFYDSDSFSQFLDYAGENGYDVTATEELASTLPESDAAIVTSPAEAFTDDELDAVASFVDNGGALLLFDQSDFGNFDATAALNGIASAVGVGFRFNDDQVVDEENNDGIGFVPTTDRFDDSFDYFDERPGLGPPELAKGERYEVDVLSVADGDTADVRFPNGYVDTVRILGIDTPETGVPENIDEWEGLSDDSYLGEWGDDAGAFAQELLADETVEIRFDDEEPLRGDFGRLLAYIDVDTDGDGRYETPYNRAAVRTGHARVYDSGFGQHDSFLKAEFAAREAGTGLWAESDPDASTTVRNGAVERLYAPYAASVRTTEGRIDAKRVPVTAAPTATQQDADVMYEDGVPLVGIDQHARVAMTGSSLIDESFEDAETVPAGVEEYGNYAFLTSLLDRLSDREGDVLIDGGHGQFGAERSVGAEDAADYLRYLEGVDLGFEQVNDLTGDLLERGRALLLSAPAEPLAEAELDALRSFVADGGGVVLLGGDVPDDHRANLDAVAEALATDLRLGRGRVLDGSSNLTGDAALPTTGAFDDWYRLFDGYDADANYKGPRAGPGVPGEGEKGGNGTGKGHGD